MKQNILIQDGTDRVLMIDTNLLTLRAQREAKRKFSTTPPPKVENDPLLLKKYAEEFKTTPPTEARIFEAALSLQKPAPEKTEDDINDDIFEEVCRQCCRWVKERKDDGTKEEVDNIITEVTPEEFYALPFDMVEYIGKTIMSKEEKSFLVLAPGQTSVS